MYYLALGDTSNFPGEENMGLKALKCWLLVGGKLCCYEWLRKASRFFMYVSGFQVCLFVHLLIYWQTKSYPEKPLYQRNESSHSGWKRGGGRSQSPTQWTASWISQAPLRALCLLRTQIENCGRAIGNQTMPWTEFRSIRRGGWEQRLRNLLATLSW